MRITRFQRARHIAIMALACAVAVTAVPLTHAQTFSVIHTFGSGEGGIAVSGVTLRNGNLYGTTSGEGSVAPGSVYQISHIGSNWITTPLALFWLMGYGPNGNVNFGPDGHLYSTTRLSGSYNRGTVFSLAPRASLCTTVTCFWTKEVVHDFRGSPQDGSDPELGDLAWDQQGNLYGVTSEGGAFGHGAAFQITQSGNNWTENLIHSFANNPDGAVPQDGVIVDKNGNVFGTTVEGGSQSSGTIYKLSNSGNGWQETILYNFQGGSDGAVPTGLISDSAGNLYGATRDVAGYAGTVFELSPSGNTWTFTVLANLPGPNRCGPVAALAMDAAGNLYGTTACSGAYRLGTVFELTNTQNGWIYTSLHDFTGNEDGAQPESNVTIDSDGTIYGTAAYGGNGYYSAGQGTVWMIKP